MVTAVPDVPVGKSRDQYTTNEQRFLDTDFDETETYEIMNNTYASDIDNTDDDAGINEIQPDHELTNIRLAQEPCGYQNGSDAMLFDIHDRSPVSEISEAKQMVVYLSGTGDTEKDKLLEEEGLIEVDDPSTGM